MWVPFLPAMLVFEFDDFMNKFEMVWVRSVLVIKTPEFNTMTNI